MQNKLLTSKQAAAYIGYSEYSLRVTRACANRTLGGIAPPPHIKLGRTVRYKVVDLDRWINSLGDQQ